MAFTKKTNNKWILAAVIGSLLILSFSFVSPSHARSAHQIDDNITNISFGLPEYSPPINTLENQLIFKGFQDDTLNYLPIPTCDDSTEDCESQSTAYMKPEHPPVTSALFSFPLDNRALIEDPLVWPNSPTIKLLALWPSGATSTCSGMLVDAKHMLTAAHCIYSHNSDLCNEDQDSCWVEDLEIIPAYHLGDAPLGKTGFDTILTWTAWTENRDFTYDLAAVELRYPLGAYIGWLGFGFNTDDSFFLDHTFASNSYPYENPYDGKQMVGWSGNISAADNHQLRYPFSSFDGQDGATLNDDGAVTFGVLSHLTADQHTVYTRLTYDKFDAIRLFIDEGRPKGMGDLTVFNVNAEPDLAFPGQKINTLNFYIQNHSEVDIPSQLYTANIIFSAVAKADDDYQVLASFEFDQAFAANTGSRLSIPPGIAVYLPEAIQGPGPLGGIYYLGVIVSSDEPDYNPENNRSTHFQTQALWVYDSDNVHYFFPIYRQ